MILDADWSIVATCTFSHYVDFRAGLDIQFFSIRFIDIFFFDFDYFDSILDSCMRDIVHWKVW